MRTDRQSDMAKLIVTFAILRTRLKKELAYIDFSGYVAFNGMSESSREVDLAVLAYRE
jgi:predicted nucleotidyltransferase